jgi:hypothetical protein
VLGDTITWVAIDDEEQATGPETVELTRRLSVAVEEQGTVLLEAVRLNAGGTAPALDVPFAVSDPLGQGSLATTAGEDYLGTGGVFSWAAGEAGVDAVAVQLVDDTIVEPSATEFFLAQLQGAPGTTGFGTTWAFILDVGDFDYGRDTDGDGVPDGWDLDDDDDGLFDGLDAFPLDATETVDTDGDGTGDNADADDDGDFITDALEQALGFDPLDASDGGADGDGDGVSLGRELRSGSDPDDINSVPGPGYVGFRAGNFTAHDGLGTVDIIVDRVWGDTAAGGVGEVSVRFETVDVGDIEGVAYESESLTLIWADGDMEPKIVPITLKAQPGPNDDDYLLRYRLSAPTGGVGITVAEAVTVISENDVNDDDLPFGGSIEPGWFAARVRESIGVVEVPILRRGSTNGIVSAEITTDGLAALGGAEVSEVLTWADGDASVQFLRVPIPDDLSFEADEEFRIVSGDLTGDVLSNVNTEINLLDEEAALQPDYVAFTERTHRIYEPEGALELRLIRLGTDDTDRSVTPVPFPLNGLADATAGEDFDGSLREVRWEGANRKGVQAVTFPWFDDFEVEPLELAGWGLFGVFDAAVGQVFALGLAFDDDGDPTLDTDGDGLPDRIDADRDGDGVLDVIGTTAPDLLGEDPNEQTDLDGDGIGDNADTDRDGDGIGNAIEIARGTGPDDPNDPGPALDTDGDGVSDVDEVRSGSDPDEISSLPPDYALVEFTTNNGYADERDGLLRVPVRRGFNRSGAVQVGVDVVAAVSSAQAGVDYALLTPTLIWPDGQDGLQFVEIETFDDTLRQLGTAFTLELSLLSGNAVLAATRTRVAILEDDLAGATDGFGGAFFTQSNDLRVYESDGFAELWVQRGGSTDGLVTVDYRTVAGSAQPGTHFEPVSGTLRWNDGDNRPKRILVPLVDDLAANEPDAIFELLLDNPTGDSIVRFVGTAIVIADDETIARTPVSIGATWLQSAAEEDQGTVRFEVSRLGELLTPGESYSVDYQVVGAGFVGVPSALPDEDYAAQAGTLTWTGDDRSTRFVDVALIDNAVLEPAERFGLLLSNPTGGAFLRLNFQGIFLLDSGDADAVTDTDGDGTPDLWDLDSDGDGVLNFNDAFPLDPGEVADLDVDGIGDNTDPDADGDGISAVDEAALRLNDLDPVDAGIDFDGDGFTALEEVQAGTREFDAGSVPGYAGDIVVEAYIDSVPEGLGTARVVYKRIRGSEGAVTIDVSTVDDSARVGSDYAAVATTLSWGDGDVTDRLLTVPIIDDAVQEPAERLRVEVTGSTGGVRVLDPEAWISIIDDDGLPARPGEVVLRTRSVRAEEDQGIVALEFLRVGGSLGSVSVDVGLDRPVDVPGDYFDFAEVGQDLAPLAETLTWGPGETDARTVLLTLIDDDQREDSEYVPLLVTNPQGGVEIVNPLPLVRIHDDDGVSSPTGRITVHRAAPLGSETSGVVRIPIYRDGPAAGAVSVSVTTFTLGRSPTTVADADFTSTFTTLSWPAGDRSVQVVDIPILPDGEPEPAELIGLFVFNPTNGAELDGLEEFAPSVGTVRFPTIAANLAGALGDLDSDGIPDALDRDADGDGLDNDVENINALDWRDPLDVLLDTDSDGFDNLTEIRAGSSFGNPLDTPERVGGGLFSDLDGDGIPDPADDDDDGDGAPDLIELAEGRDPQDASFENVDPDGDGVSTGRELAEGTDPGNGNDVARAGDLRVRHLIQGVEEAQGFATVLVERVGGRLGAVSVDYSTLDDTARAGTDYRSRSGTLRWADGEAGVRAVTVPIERDPLLEQTEYLRVGFTNATGGARILDAEGWISIRDDDGYVAGRSSFDLDADLTRVDEGNGVLELTVSRSGDGSGAASVDFGVLGLSTDASLPPAVVGEDLLESRGTLSWLDGETGPRTVRIPILDDAVPEPLEYFHVVLLDPVGAAIGDRIAVVEIVDDDRFVESGAIAVNRFALPGQRTERPRADHPLPGGGYAG